MTFQRLHDFALDVLPYGRPSAHCQSVEEYAQKRPLGLRELCHGASDVILHQEGKVVRAQRELATAEASHTSQLEYITVATHCDASIRGLDSLWEHRGLTKARPVLCCPPSLRVRERTLPATNLVCSYTVGAWRVSFVDEISQELERQNVQASLKHAFVAVQRV